MIEIGKILREARERNNLTIDDIQIGTKIRSKYIKALEEGTFNLLPGGEIYVKGFIKNYCEVVGLNQHEVLRRYKELRDKENEPKMQETKQEIKETVEKRIGFNKTIVSLSLIFVVLILFLGYKQFTAGNRDNAQQPPNLEEPQGNIPNDDEENTVTDIPTEPVVSDVPNYRLVHNTSSLTEYEIIVKEDLELQLSTFPGERSWIRVTIDGRMVFEGTMSGGESKSWKAKDLIQINIGRPLIASANINGIDLGSLGGEARIIKFVKSE